MMTIYSKFEVEDNGIGITKEKQEHMFESFSQGLFKSIENMVEQDLDYQL